jgi:Alw26I/Eco31I/Esp3I family type II restriction m6 adenine DNA methyltransferase
MYSGKTLAERITGRFYTPDTVAADLANEMVKAFAVSKAAPVLDVVDPFCGDGRLVAALLRRAADEPWLSWSRWRIALWDRDEEALATAQSRLREVATNLGLPVSITAREGDSFTLDTKEQFDFVITNPPWELLKPDHRELSHFTLADREQYRNRLRQVCDDLDRRFPEAKAANAWGGWATNLARCGWDLSMRLLKRHGVLGIVLPSSLFADQSSERLRRSAFTRCRLVGMAAYPAEARLFDRVDQPVVSVTMAADGQTGGTARLRLFDAALRKKSVVDIVGDEKLAARGYSICVGFGAASGDILDLLRPFPKLRDFEGSGGNDLWLGRELDETRLSEKLTSGCEFPFVKGRMVNRHSIVEAPTRSVRAEFANRLESVARPRAVWRDVSRASQKRRMIGTVIPKGWVAGNSLHVGCYWDGNHNRTYALQGILSSLLLEFQVRCRLATGHMSLGVVRDAHVPKLDEQLASRLAEEAKRVAAGSAADGLEVLVAHTYGFGREAFARVLESFEKISGEERERLLDKRLWAAYAM